LGMGLSHNDHSVSNADLRYSVSSGAEEATLRVDGPQEPLAGYLKYLQANWNQ
jgi:hypothetical protein